METNSFSIGILLLLSNLQFQPLSKPQCEPNSVSSQTALFDTNAATQFPHTLERLTLITTLVLSSIPILILETAVGRIFRQPTSSKENVISGQLHLTFLQ